MTKQLNILHLLSWPPTPENPTLSNFCFRHINALPEDCRSVVLTVITGPTANINCSEDVHYTHVQVTVRHSDNALVRKTRIWRGYQRGLAYVRQHLFTPDLIHVHVTYPAGTVALYWKKHYGIPYVITEHWTGYQPQNSEQLSASRLRLLKRIARYASTIMPVSKDLALNMQRCGMEGHYRVIYNVTDTDCFTLKEPNHQECKQILHVSTLRDDAKNFSGILRVMERLHQQRNNFVLNVVHDYEAPQDIRDFVQQHGLAETVIFHGRKNTEEMADMYRHSDFLLLFSNFENLPCVIVEAFACGLPVLATRVGGIAESVDDTRGILVEARDEEALLAQTNHLLDHARSYNAEAIRQYAVERFAPWVIGGQIGNVYGES